MKQILIIAFSDLENDPRVYRQIRYLLPYYKISTVGWEPAGVEGVAFYKITPCSRSRWRRIQRSVRYKLGDYENLYWELYPFEPVQKALLQETFDLVIANDIDTLPFALKIAAGMGAKVLFDSHEYAPRQFEDRWVWRFIFRGFNHYLCKTYMPKCDQVITVSSGLAAEYDREYGIKPEVITNAADYYPLQPTPVDKDHIRIITHGVANPNRRLESMIEVMDEVDSRFHLDLMLLPTYPRYYKRLQAMAAKRKNVSMVPPVPMNQIVPVTNKYDLSFILFKPYTINFRHGLFNKFFESIQARLAIISGPTPTAHVEIIKKYNCGILAESFEYLEFARRINELTAPQIEIYKHQSHIAASELNADQNMASFLRLVAAMLEEKNTGT